MKKQKQKQTVDEEFVAIKKNKIQVWQDAEDTALQYFKSAQQKRKAAQSQLSKYLRKFKSQKVKN